MRIRLKAEMVTAGPAERGRSCRDVGIDAVQETSTVWAVGYSKNRPAALAEAGEGAGR